MVINRAIKVRIYPSKEQKLFMDNTLGACRYIYNKMLARNNKIYKRRKEHLTYNQMQNLLPVMKTYLHWLKEVDSQGLKYACRNLDNAYKRFFKHESDYPRFKSKRGRQSYVTTNTNTIKYLNDDKNHISLPCLGIIKCRGKRKLPDDYKICNATISKETDGKYYCSICYKYETDIKPQILTEPKTIGLDFQIHGLYVDSNRRTLDFPKWYQDNLKRLARMQKFVARKHGSRKGEIKSNNFRKQQAKIAKLQHHIANQRLNFLHQQSNAIAKHYLAVCIEDLSVKEMMLRVEDTHDRKLRRGTNKAYSNNGWYMFTKMLDYKLKQSGGQLIKVDKYFKSSLTCHCCGAINPITKDVQVKIWKCSNCNSILDRDNNAAINIKNEGMRILKIA